MRSASLRAGPPRAAAAASIRPAPPAPAPAGAARDDREADPLLSPTAAWLIAGLGGGIVASVASTAVQLLLWAATAQPVAALVVRDSRLAAAILLGPGVLRPDPDTALVAVMTAAVVHGALSLAYGLAIALPLAARAPLPPWLAGAIAGAALYALNMHGFTAVWPWFEQVRDAVTVAAHVAFGVASAQVSGYLLRRLR